MSIEITADQLLDTALTLGMNNGWESLTLMDVALSLQVPINDIYVIIQQKDDLAEALFNRADNQMLAITEETEFQTSDQQQRLQLLISAWLNTLTPYRPVVQQMLCYKLEFGHVHLQVLGLMRISRTVQWMLHASSISDTGLRRILGEIILTNIYLASFSYWLITSPDEPTMQQFLGKLLRCYK